MSAQQPRPWRVSLDLAYTEAIPVTGGDRNRAHVPYGRIRLARVLGRGISVAADLLAPVGPMPYGQIGGGLSLNKRWKLTRESQVTGLSSRYTERWLQLVTGLGGGWALINSGYSEGYHALSRSSTQYDGPFGRVDVALEGVIAFAGSFGLTASFSLGGGFTYARYRTPANVATPVGGWRVNLDALLGGGLLF